MRIRTRVRRDIRFMTKSEIRKIIDSIPTTKRDGATGYHYPDRYGFRDRALFEVLFSTGLRISECLRLPRKFFEEILKLGNDETVEYTLIGKGGWQRVVFFSPATLKSLQDYLEQREDPLPSLFPMTVRTAQRVIKRRAIVAGLGNWVTPHKIRHSYATNLLKRGASIYHVQRFLGHRNLQTTTIYLHATDKELADIHKAIYKDDEPENGQ